MKRIHHNDIKKGDILKVTDEEKILQVISDSPKALSFEIIHVETSEDRYMPRQRLRQLLRKLNDEEKIDMKTYTINYSKKPKIDSVIAEIYYKNVKQRQIYERDDLPLILSEARKTIS